MAQHDFSKKFFKHPVWCTYCTEFLWGVVKSQGSKCKVCKAIVHEKCRTIAGQCPGAGFYKDKGARPAAPPPGGAAPTTGNTSTNSYSGSNSSTNGSAASAPATGYAAPVGGVQPATGYPPSPAPAKRMVRALFDFPPENERELELKAGDVVEILRVDDEWWFGQFPDGREGYFPGTYVEKIGSW